MFLSRLVLNSKNPIVRRHIASPYEMHKTILGFGFGAIPKSELGRVLFRIDEDPTGRSSPIVLVQSPLQPDWSTLPENYTTDRPDWKPYDPQFQVGQLLRFRLRANPTKRVAAKNVALGATCAGKRVGLLTEGDQQRWFLTKAEQGGFCVAGKWERFDTQEVANFRFDVIPEGRVWNSKGGEGWFLSVRFEGILKVTNTTAFRTLIETGIGTAKGYGFGLLSVASI